MNRFLFLWLVFPLNAFGQVSVAWDYPPDSLEQPDGTCVASPCADGFRVFVEETNPPGPTRNYDIAGQPPVMSYDIAGLVEGAQYRTWVVALDNTGQPDEVQSLDSNRILFTHAPPSVTIQLPAPPTTIQLNYQ